MVPGPMSTVLIDEDCRLGEGSSVGAFSSLGLDGQGEPLRVGVNAVIRSHTVLYRGVCVGDHFSTGHHVVIRSGTRIGNRVSIGTGSVVEHDVVIEDGVRLHSRCFVPELTVIEEGAWLGPGVILTNARYPNRPETKSKLQGVRVGRNAVLGAASLVLPGVHIGEGATIGAGAVVVRDVEPGSTVVGNPARMREAGA